MAYGSYQPEPCSCIYLAFIPSTRETGTWWRWWSPEAAPYETSCLKSGPATLVLAGSVGENVMGQEEFIEDNSI